MLEHHAVRGGQRVVGELFRFDDRNALAALDRDTDGNEPFAEDAFFHR
jgi:gamma-glutamylcyclotransferase (GGCT)/AIG2-like uncharacterized protein YtfP